jgi:hypothetical protein
MFGYASFAQSTFAGLGGTAFALSISEDIALADDSAQASAFLQSITEPITVDEVENDVGGNFFGSVTEAISLADDSTQASTFLQSITEDIILADSQAVTAQFAVARAEDITIADSQVYYSDALMTALSRSP